MENIKEIRYVQAELRVNDENREITGTAIVFNSESQLLGGEFREIIQPEAISDEMLRNAEIVMLYNHQESTGVLAKYKRGTGSLKIWKDERGVHFSFKAKRTAFGDEILESVRNKDLEACSFGFIFERGKNYDTWQKRNDGTYLRKINTISNLFDFSIVVNPAYRTTDVYTRGLDELKQSELETIKATELEEIRKNSELKSYYENYSNMIAALKK